MQNLYNYIRTPDPDLSVQNRAEGGVAENTLVLDGTMATRTNKDAKSDSEGKLSPLTSLLTTLRTKTQVSGAKF